MPVITVSTQTKRFRSIGRKLLKQYFDIANIQQDQREYYQITDAITALMHAAHAQQFDVPAIHRSAAIHFQAETAVCQHCGRLGDLEDHDCDPVTKAQQ